MLKRENRLTSVRLNSPRKISTPQFILSIARNNQNTNRFAFVVSKKIDKRAVVRNALKRKIRSCVEEIFDSIHIGYDFVFYPKSLAIDASRESILEELEKVFKKEGLLNV